MVERRYTGGIQKGGYRHHSLGGVEVHVGLGGTVVPAFPVVTTLGSGRDRPWESRGQKRKADIRIII